MVSVLCVALDTFSASVRIWDLHFGWRWRRWCFVVWACAYAWVICSFSFLDVVSGAAHNAHARFTSHNLVIRIHFMRIHSVQGYYCCCKNIDCYIQNKTIHTTHKWFPLFYWRENELEIFRSTVFFPLENMSVLTRQKQRERVVYSSCCC